jgi:hypothetical protein
VPIELVTAIDVSAITIYRAAENARFLTELGKRLAAGVVLFRAFELPAKAYYEILRCIGDHPNSLRDDVYPWTIRRAPLDGR